MANHAKSAIIPYESLIDFANEEIAVDNWKRTLSKLSNRPFLRPWPDDPDEQNQAIQEWEMTYKGLGFLALRPSKTITRPEPLREVQQELRHDLERLTGSQDRDVRGVFNKILWVNAGEETRRMLFHENSGASDSRILVTDRVHEITILTGLRDFVYFRLGKLWENGLLHRIGRCQNPKCPRFFLAKTNREDRRYCSQRCGQKPTGPKRAQDTRVRRAEWEGARTDLHRALENLRTLRRITERQALDQAEATLTKAKRAFEAAYPRKKGPGYEGGEALLARATEQIKRLRKKVKGY